jgi:hypothetical protein
MTAALHRTAWPVLLGGIALGLGALVTVSPALGAISILGLVLAAFVVNARNGIPLLLLGATAVAAILYVQATQGAVPSSAKYATDVLLLAGIGFLPRIRGLFGSREQSVANKVLMWTLASATVGALGATDLHATVIANWQDIRWLGALGVGLLVADFVEPGKRRAWAFRWLLALNLLNAAVSVYQVLTHAYAATRLGLPEITGLFGQTTANSIAATLLLIFVLVEYPNKPRPMSAGEMRLAVGIGLLDLLLSTRFKPGLAILAVLALGYLRHVGVRPLAIAFLGAAVPIGVTFAFAWITAPSRGQSESEAVASVLAHAQPRVQFMSGAQVLAAKRLPLGEGSGTYGSDISPAAEQSAFGKAGLAGVYGFRAHDPQFNSDNFVARVLGERGYAGLAAWLISLAALIYFALTSCPWRFPASVAIAAAALAPVVPIFRDGSAALVLFLPAALCLAAKGSSEAMR